MCVLSGVACDDGDWHAEFGNEVLTLWVQTYAWMVSVHGGF
jgi:hypothetical protein